MEKVPFNSRKYKNYRFDKYKHNSVKEENQSEFDLITKDTYESQIKNKLTNISKKENSNFSQIDKNFPTKNNDNVPNYKKNNRRLVYNSINQNIFDNTDNNFSEYNNEGNVYRTQVSSSNKNTNNISQDKDNSINKNRHINKNNSHNFSNLAKTLKYFNNKISFNNNNNNIFYDIYYDANSGKKMRTNKNTSKNDFSSDKISLNLEDKNLYNLLKNGNFHNFSIQANNNKKNINTLISSFGSKNNSIWTNINKELLPREIDLQNNFLNDEEENKSKTPMKINDRYFKNSFKSNTIEKNYLDDKKKGLEKRTKEILNQNEWKSNTKNREVKKDNEDDDEEKNLVTMKTKDSNDNKQAYKEESDRSIVKKYNSINNTNNLKKPFNQDNNKNKYVNQTNKIMINKVQNQTKNYNTINLLNKKTKYNNSSPNVLNQFHPLNIKNLNFKSPMPYKDISIFNSTFSNSGKVASRNNASFECSFENYPSLKNLNNIHVNLINQSSPLRNNKKSVPKASINLDRNKNKNKLIIQIEKEKEANDINSNQNKNMILNKKELKPILIQSDMKNILTKTKSSTNTDTNNSKITNTENNNVSNNKNQFYIKQNNKIIFQKKVNRSPMGFNKKLNMHKNSNNELSQNSRAILKITDNSSANLKKSMIENRFKIDKNIYNYNFVSNNNNNNNSVSQNIESNNKNTKMINSIDSYKNANVSSGINKKVYIKQKAKKKLEQTKTITQGKLDTKRISQMKSEQKYNNNFNEKNDLYNNDYFDYYPMENIKTKINTQKENLITKYYDYFINYPKLEKCSYSRAFFKIKKIPEIEVCHMSKVKIQIYITYKNKSVCYFTKIRVIGIAITLPPVNSNCEFSKNIIINPPEHKTKKIEEEEKKLERANNQKKALPPKKNKKRKKRRKTRASLKGKENNKNENKSNNEENDNDNEQDNNLDNNENENDKENDENIIIEKEETKEEKDQIINMEKEANIISNINYNNSPNLEGNNKNLRKIIINNRSPKYRSSNDEKSCGISEREVVITDIEKNCSLKSPTIYNDEDFNDEENDDFRIESDEDEEISKDKYKKNDIEKEYKTEGKEITGDYNKNKMANKQKTTKGFKILEKLQGKRNSVEYHNMNNLYFNKEMGEYNENQYIDDGNNYEGKNKNIALATSKLNEIFNNQRNYVYNDEDNEEIENEENNENYSNDYIEKNSAQNRQDINYNIYRKKNNTYKKNINYEKIGTIFDRLEGIIDKKKTNKKLSIIGINSENAENEKCKTPLLKMGGNIKNKIDEFNFDLKENNYYYNDDNYQKNNENENDNDNNTDNKSNNENENEADSEERKDNYLKKDMDMNKYKEIFNKQQIISKLESLMNKPKKEYNNDFEENIFNSPKIESEIDTDVNANKDTPGNRKEIKKSYLLQIQNSIINKKIYTFEEIISYKNKKICLNNNLLSLEVIKHCHEISNNIEHKDSFKANYKNIVMNSNNYVYNRKNNSSNNLANKEKEPCMGQWARKDMTKEIEEAEKYMKELNSKMSKDNYKHKIIEVLNTLTVDNYKNIFNKMIEMLYLSENPKNNKVELNKTEYLLHNQCIFVEIILDKATIEKGYVVLYAKLCADLFIHLIKLIKEYNNPEIGNQLINGENLKTILTTECRQRFEECTSISSLSEKANDFEKKELFLIFKKKFLGNMDFIAELINVKILSQTKGFEFLDILYKRYIEIKNNDKIKFLNLEGAVTLLTKFGRIIMNRKNPKHVQNLDNYINYNLYPIISDNNSKNNDNKGLPNYLKFKIINLIEKKKNNWKDSLYEQSIVAKGKNSNISISHDLTDSNINIDESLLDNQKFINNVNKEKEEDKIIILLKNDIENYVSFLSEHNITNKQELNNYNNQNENSDINNEYNWSISEELIIKTKNELEEIIRCYIEVCIDYVTKKKNIFFCNEYIKNIVNYYSLDLTKDEIEKVHESMNDLYLNIEDICIDNYFMLEVMGYLLLILLNNNLYYLEDLNKFINEDKERISKISQVIKFSIAHSEDKSKDLYHNFKKIKLYTDNKNIFEEYIEKPLINDYDMDFK